MSRPEGSAIDPVCEIADLSAAGGSRLEKRAMLEFLLAQLPEAAIDVVLVELLHAMVAGLAVALRRLRRRR